MSQRDEGNDASKWHRGGEDEEEDAEYQHDAEDEDEDVLSDEYDDEYNAHEGRAAEEDDEQASAHRTRRRARRQPNSLDPESSGAAREPKEAPEEAALRDKRWLVQRRVIDEAMIREAVREELFADYDRMYVPEPDQINLRDVTTLILSFRSVDCINNLHGFEGLVKLQLDNNVIERIQNLERLVNLQWLDLSFNFITSIEGLDRLTKLTDLSLFNNRIRTIGGGLDKLTNLNVLSIGNNEITELDQLRLLRKFKNLRVLTLKGNPVCAEDDCRHTVLAFVDQLKYLDYELIDPRQVKEAYDKKMELILELRAKEKEEAEAAAVAAAAADQRAELQRIGMEGVDTLFDTIVLHDKDLAKLTVLPGAVHVLSVYRARVEGIVKELQEDALLQYRRKRVDEAAFRAAKDKMISANVDKLVSLIQAFEHRKKVVFRAPQKEALIALKRAAVELSDQLMDVEMRTVKDVNQIVNEFAEVYTRISKDAEGRISKCFSLITEAAKQCERDLMDHVHELTEKMQKDDHAAESWPQEVVTLISDKDAVSTLISAAHDFQCAQVLKVEEDVRSGEEKGTDGLLKSVQQAEYARNRKRVGEIYELCEKYIAAINEQGRALMAAKAASVSTTAGTAAGGATKG
jgi:hypothetical protein